MLTFKVTAAGSSDGLILNDETKQILDVQDGDTFYLTEAPDGAMRLTPFNPEFARQMALAESIMHDDREILRALAR